MSHQTSLFMLFIFLPTTTVVMVVIGRRSLSFCAKKDTAQQDYKNLFVRSSILIGMLGMIASGVVILCTSASLMLFINDVSREWIEGNLGLSSEDYLLSISRFVPRYIPATTMVWMISISIIMLGASRISHFRKSDGASL